MSMTHDEMIAVLQAHKEGKAIQAKSKHDLDLDAKWQAFTTHLACGWDTFTWDYRVKPEPPKPRERWIAFCPIAGHIERVTETKPILECSECRCFFVREVLEDSSVH